MTISVLAAECFVCRTNLYHSHSKKNSELRSSSNSLRSPLAHNSAVSSASSALAPHTSQLPRRSRLVTLRSSLRNKLPRGHNRERKHLQQEPNFSYVNIDINTDNSLGEEEVS